MVHNLLATGVSILLSSKKIIKGYFQLASPGSSRTRMIVWLWCGCDLSICTTREYWAVLNALQRCECRLVGDLTCEVELETTQYCLAMHAIKDQWCYSHTIIFSWSGLAVWMQVCLLLCVGHAAVRYAWPDICATYVSTNQECTIETCC